MWHYFNQWQARLELRDPVEQQQGMLLQRFLLIMTATSMLGLAFFLALALREPYVIIFAMICLFGMFSMGTALVILRGGRFQTSITIVSVGLITLFAIAGLSLDFEHGSPYLITYLLPLSFVGLLGKRSTLLACYLLTALTIILVAMQPRIVGGSIRFFPTPLNDSLPVVGVFIMTTGVLCVLFYLFANSLRQVLITVLHRERDLHTLSVSLEQQVTNRTAALQQSLYTVEQREQHLADTLGKLQMSQETIRSLSAPIIPVLSGVLVVPLIGALDNSHIERLTYNLLEEVQRSHIRAVIFDLTGILLIDTHIAQKLVQAIKALRLLGADVLVVGIRPEVAQTVVALHIELGVSGTYADLRDAVEQQLLARN